MRVIIFLFLIIINLLLYIIFVKLVKQEQKKEYVLYGSLFDCIIINNQGGHVCDRDKALT
jgi:cell division protein FtsI/penicillin-binding protein 2